MRELFEGAVYSRKYSNLFFQSTGDLVASLSFSMVRSNYNMYASLVNSLVVAGLPFQNGWHCMPMI